MFNLENMNPIMTAAAVIPAVILLIRVYRKDRLEKEPVHLLLALLVLGVLSTAFAMVMETIGTLILESFFFYDTLLYRVLMYFIVVGCSEEGGKYLLLKLRTWKSAEFNCQFDGLVYAVFVSLGFAVWENIGYVASYGLETAMVRAITAIPGHASFGVFMGIWYGLAKRYQLAGDNKSSKLCRRMAFLFPVFIHGAYDFLASVPESYASWLFLPYIVVLFLICFFLINKMSKWDEYIDA